MSNSMLFQLIVEHESERTASCSINQRPGVHMTKAKTVCCVDRLCAITAFASVDSIKQ